MAVPYVRERQVEYWTSRGIETYFQDAGYEVVTFPLTQLIEHDLPFDFLHLDRGTSKVFGLQYKALYGNGDDHWRLDPGQHERLQPFCSWGYYLLSEVRDTREHRTALHHARIMTVNSPGSLRVVYGQSFTYWRWGGFADALRRCKVGRKVRTREEIETLLEPLMKGSSAELNSLLDVFALNLDERRLLHLDPRLRASSRHSED